MGCAVDEASSVTTTGSLVDPEIGVKVPVDFVNT